MNIIKKFNYPILERINLPEGRKYLTPKGEYLPSVTTILSKTKSQDSIDKLNSWRERVGKEEADRITDFSSRLGTIIHNQLEQYILGNSLIWKNNHINNIAKIMVKTIITQGLSKIDCVYGLEANLYFSNLYSGTADLIIGIGDEIIIADFKNTIKMKKEEWIDDYFIQSCAYALAHNNMFGTNIQSAKIMMVSQPNEYDSTCEYTEFNINGNKFIHFKNKWIDKLETFYNVKEF